MTSGTADPVEVVQLGLGGWGADWATTVLPQAPGLRVIGWVDPDPRRRQQAVARLGVPPDRVAADLDSCAPARDARLALITAPAQAHAGLAAAALRSGLHVLLEKPLALDLHQALELTRLAEDVGRQLVVAQNYRYFAAARVALQIVGRGELGTVRTVRGTFRREHHIWNAPPGSASSPESSVVHQIAVHHLDLVRALVGDVQRVAAWPWDVTDDEFAHPAFDALMVAGSVPVHYSACAVWRGRATPWSGAWHVEGDQGELRWQGRDARDGAGVRTRSTRSAGWVEHPVPEGSRDDRLALIDDLLVALGGGAPAPTRARANLGTVAAMVALREALDTGRSVEVASSEPATRAGTDD